MALKPDRVEHLTDLSYFMNSAQERGGVVVHNTGGSGAAMDTDRATVAVPTAGVSGTNAAGLLLNDVVNLDLTRQHINFHKDEVQQGSKVLVLRRGTVVTDQVSGTPTVGAKAYYNKLGELSPNTSVATNPVYTEVPVGRFLGLLDADGFVKVEINIV